MTGVETSSLLDQLNAERRRVDVGVADFTVREVVRLVNEGELNAAPAYQRKFRWTLDDESRLIESLLLGLPVPSVFVASNEDFSLEVVDGLQRVSTLVHFLAPSADDLARIGRDSPLALTSVDKLDEVQGLTFEELPAEVQRYFGRLPIRMTTLTDKSDVGVRFQLFERLNRGAIALSPQEVRTVVFRGPFMELIKELADLPRFHELVKLQTAQEDDGTRAELVLKFFAYLDWFEDYDGRVTEFLNDYAREHQEPTDIDQRRDLFSSAVDVLADAIETPLLRPGYHSTPLNQVEAALVGSGRLLRAGAEIKEDVPEIATDEDLIAASTKGTNTRPSFRRRIERAEELLSG